MAHLRKMPGSTKRNVVGDKTRRYMQIQVMNDLVDNGQQFKYLESDGKPMEAWAQVRGLI